MIALVVSLVAAIAQPRAATCPRGMWIEGIRPSGAYRCLLTVGDNDAPAIDRVDGRLWCAPNELALVVDYRRARCVRRRRDGGDLYRRVQAQMRRARLRAAGLCISAAAHGPATHGVLCARCRAQHRRSS